MKYEEMLSYLKKKVPVANKRLKRILESNYDKTSHAYQYLYKSITNKADFTLRVPKADLVQFRGDFSKMSKEQIRHEYNLLQSYLKSETSSISGIKALEKRNYETFKANNNVDLTFSEYKAIFSGYEKSILSDDTGWSDVILDLIKDKRVNNKDIPYIIQDLNKDNVDKGRIEIDKVIDRRLEQFNAIKKRLL